MRGVANRMRAEGEARTALAWQCAALSGLAQAGKLKPLDQYLAPSPGKASPGTIARRLKDYIARGAPMTITEHRPQATPEG